MIEFVLPRAPSSNRIWRKGRNGNIHKSDEYTHWLRDAGWEIQAQKGGQPMPKPPYNIVLTMHESEAVDLDNVIKATLDLLEAQNVITDDKLVYQLLARRSSSGLVPGEVVVMVAQYTTHIPIAMEEAHGSS